jgi:Ras family protein A
MRNNKKGSLPKVRKLVVVGDGMAGKTCLLFAFKDDNFDPSHPPTIFDTYLAEIELDGKTVSKRYRFSNIILHNLQFNLALYDTAGQEAYARLRPLSYTDTNVVLICFSVDSPTSAINVIEEWNPEVRHFCGACPVILVACKIDLRTDQQTIEKLKEQDEKPVTTEVGKKIAAQIKADAYMECSAKTREGIHDLFIHAARLSLEKRSRSKRHRKCCLY